MPQECPVCKQTDIADGALKCHHCLSWLDDTKSNDEFEAFRREMRTELSSDLDKHRASTKELLTRMQYFAGIIAVIAGGFAVYFTGVTRENITQTTNRIASAATTGVQQAANEASQQARMRVDEVITTRVTEVIAARLATPEVRTDIAAQVSAALDERVTVEVAERLDEVEALLKQEADSALAEAQTAVAEIRAVIDGQIAQADASLAAVEEQIAELTARTQEALGGLAGIQSGLEQEVVGDIEEISGFQIVQSDPKAEIERLADLVDQKINALSFRLGDFYFGPVVWKYLDALTDLPEFRYVVLLDRDGRAVGFWDARVLADALNPPDQTELSMSLAAQPDEVPATRDVPRWNAFGTMLANGLLERLESLDGYQPTTNAIPSNTSNFEALERLEALGAETLPVLDAEGTLVGFVEQSRLTTRMLLQIANR